MTNFDSYIAIVVCRNLMHNSHFMFSSKKNLNMIRHLNMIQ